MSLFNLYTVLLMQCRGLVNIANVKVMSVDLKIEMDSKSRVACLRRAFRRALVEVFMPEAYIESRGTIARSPSLMHHRSSFYKTLPLRIKDRGPPRSRTVLK
jgi:hypothetical protein